LNSVWSSFAEYHFYKNLEDFMRAFIILVLWLPSLSAWAVESQPILSLKYNGLAKPIGLNALVNLEDSMPDCVQGVMDATIEKLNFDGASTRIIGFRAKTKSGGYQYLNISPRLYSSLSVAELEWIPSLLKEGKAIVVTFQQCGAGGRVFSARDIYAR
jgi:hypothetical protein